MNKILWDDPAQTDREQIYIYFFEQAGLLLADRIDARFEELAALLLTNPVAGVKARKNTDDRYRKLIVPHFPFILLYRYDDNEIHILRVLHTSRRVTSLF
ncbi:type II toxin-antitoxin system RelE/ParE family toxin (plasmid) [Serratia nevei]|uniref:type II toxin-antitoxin system RelE/ParE family toxin n=1 Tax=Serratia nevei TaxID=2703794 RepID=UPI003F6BD311